MKSFQDNKDEKTLWEQNEDWIEKDEKESERRVKLQRELEKQNHKIIPPIEL